MKKNIVLTSKKAELIAEGFMASVEYPFLLVQTKAEDVRFYSFFTYQDMEEYVKEEGDAIHVLFASKPTGVCKCNDCGIVFDYCKKDYLDIPDLVEKLKPGSLIPAAVCHSCGGFAYPIKSN